MLFLLDENVPQSVGALLLARGHEAVSVRDYAPPGSPDAVIATVSEQMEAVLISFDGDLTR